MILSSKAERPTVMGLTGAGQGLGRHRLLSENKAAVSWTRNRRRRDFRNIREADMQQMFASRAPMTTKHLKRKLRCAVLWPAIGHLRTIRL